MSLEVSTPPLERMEKVSEAQTKGVALLAGVAGFAAARDGGAGRLVANGGAAASWALALAVLSVLCGFLAWMSVGTAHRRDVTPTWVLLTSGSVVLFGLAVASLFLAVAEADRRLERPSITLEQRGTGIAFTATIERMRANQYMRTTVYGYPPDRGPRELLFNSTSGPDAKGRSSTEGVVTPALDGYDVVEVRAFRGNVDPGCERRNQQGALLPEAGEAACAALWITPLQEPRE